MKSEYNRDSNFKKGWRILKIFEDQSPSDSNFK